jgi:hypothetical protein
MATKKITQFNSLAQTDLTSASDVLPIVDVGAPETKKITAKALVGGSVPDMVATWNDVAVTFNGIKLNVTDTASAAASKLIDLQVGSVTKFNVTKAGNTTIAGTLDVTGVSTLTGAATFKSSAKSDSATAGIGYATGAGGAETQLTSKSTGVTLNKICGTITMNNASLAHQEAVAFTLTNSAIAATDLVVVNVKSGGTAGAYLVSVGAVAAGSCSITLFNAQTSGNLSEAVVLSFAVIKAVAA